MQGWFGKKERGALIWLMWAPIDDKWTEVAFPGRTGAENGGGGRFPLTFAAIYENLAYVVIGWTIIL